MKRKRQRRQPLFDRSDYIIEAEILRAAAVMMDGRTSRKRWTEKIAAMLFFAHVHMPKGLPILSAPDRKV